MVGTGSVCVKRPGASVPRPREACWPVMQVISSVANALKCIDVHAITFVCGLLCPDPAARLTATSALLHPFLAELLSLRCANECGAYVEECSIPHSVVRMRRLVLPAAAISAMATHSVCVGTAAAASASDASAVVFAPQLAQRSRCTPPGARSGTRAGGSLALAFASGAAARIVMVPRAVRAGAAAGAPAPTVPAGAALATLVAVVRAVEARIPAPVDMVLSDRTPAPASTAPVLAARSTLKRFVASGGSGQAVGALGLGRLSTSVYRSSSVAESPESSAKRVRFTAAGHAGGGATTTSAAVALDVARPPSRVRPPEHRRSAGAVGGGAPSAQRRDGNRDEDSSSDELDL